MPSLRYLLLALLPITSSSFAEERIETFEFESQSAYGPLGNSQNGQIQISLPPGRSRTDLYRWSCVPL